MPYLLTLYLNMQLICNSICKYIHIFQSRKNLPDRFDFYIKKRKSLFCFRYIPTFYTLLDFIKKRFFKNNLFLNNDKNTEKNAVKKYTAGSVCL